MKRIKCRCGAKFRTRSELNEHILIGRPGVPLISRLTRITPEMVEEARKERDLYDKEHGII